MSSGSSIVGWAIEQGKTVTIEEGKQEVVEFKESLGGGASRKKLPELGPSSFFHEEGWSSDCHLGQPRKQPFPLFGCHKYILLHIHACIIHGNQLPMREPREPQEPMGTWELKNIPS